MMAAFEKRRVIVTRHEYALKSPAHASEVQKAITAAVQDIEAAVGKGSQIDQDIWLEARDDEVIVVWTEHAESPKVHKRKVIGLDDAAMEA